LRELFGDDVVDSTQIISLYKEYEGRIHPQHLWGGMTTFWLIGQNNIDRTNIEEKIKDRFYDFIIYGAIQRCKQYYELVSKVYPKEKVILIDGNDEPNLDPLYQKHLYFKRELVTKHPNLIPITFGIPTPKLAMPDKNKTQDYATCIPGQPETYIFKDEKSYYQDYQKSFYGVTMKKAGWDALRHYEIMGNGCMPLFDNITECPRHTMMHVPKALLVKIMFWNATDPKWLAKEYSYYLSELQRYFMKFCTTKAVAQRFIDKVNLHA